MPNIFIPGDESVSKLVDYTMEKWHQDLFKAKVKVGVIIVIPASESKAALKEAGHPVVGSIRIVSPKDRVMKHYDVELLLDGDEWKNDTREHQTAKIDHFLSRLEVKKPKPKKKKKAKGTEGAVHGSDEERTEHEAEEFMTDDIGRPKLKLRAGDWNAGFGFTAVVERHGGHAPEVIRLHKAKAIMDGASQGSSDES